MKYRVTRREFAAKQHPLGSPERTMLNKDWLTSEYMPSYKYGIRGDNGEETPFVYRTKQEAVIKAALLNGEITS